MYNVLIIGAGPIGLACGIEAAKRNMSYLILEKGCLVNSLFHYPTNMTFFSTSERLEIGDVPFVSHGDKPTRRESLEYYRRVKEAWKLNVNSFEKVLSIKKNSSGFEILSEKNSYLAKKIIIATGFYDHPNKLNVTGEDLPKVKHYFDEAHPYAYLKVAVIGGGNSSVDAALETFRRGSEVTMIVREEKLKDSVKYWVRPDIDNRINEGSIKAFFNSEITSIRENEIDVQTPDGKVTIENDFVLAMTGYHPDFDFLKSIGIEINQSPEMSPVFNPETFETNVEGIFLAGVVCGGMETGKWFIENSRYHPAKIFDKIQKDL
ncbi:MAG: YpdA family putative bacillithiol disulfide reductase [Ignavibacteriales bacterium]|nr:YpdA family putative bacillithiol disulfide reductase [Ignavibacteriales bacterium]